MADVEVRVLSPEFVRALLITLDTYKYCLQRTLTWYDDDVINNNSNRNDNSNNDNIYNNNDNNKKKKKKEKKEKKKKKQIRSNQNKRLSYECRCNSFLINCNLPLGFEIST